MEVSLGTRSLRSLSQQAEAVLRLGESHLKEGQLTLAREAAERALVVLEQVGYRSRLGNAYKLHAHVLMAQAHHSLALSAAGQALLYPDLTAADRARVYGVIAICFTYLFDLPTARAVIEQRALHEADRSADPSIIVACYGLAARVSHIFACWADNIPHHVTLGIDRPDNLETSAEYLNRAQRYLTVCEEYAHRVSPPERVWSLGTRGTLVARSEGFSAAWPIFEQALAMADNPRRKACLLLVAAMSARITKCWDRALALIDQVQQNDMLTADDTLQHDIHHELSHIYCALDRPTDAYRSLQTFTRLHASKSRLAHTWINDSPNLNRYGKQLDLQRLRSSVLEPPEPPALSRALQYIEENIDRRLPVPDVARHAGISTRTLQSMYQEFKGVAASDFIRERKMQHAHQLLRNVSFPVRLIAEAVGYSKSANFSRDFRRRFGCTPMEIRRRPSSRNLPQAI